MNSFWITILEYYKSCGVVGIPLILHTFILWYAIGSRYSHLKMLAGQVKSQNVSSDSFLLMTSDKIYRQSLKKYTTIINAIVVTAPLLGLLGTVSGMIETFNSLADNSLYAQSGGIAGGISVALFSTQFGLVVAVPGIIAGKLLDRMAIL